MSDMDRVIAFFKTSLILCGILLIMTGTVLSMFYAYVAYQLIMHPEDVEIVKYIESVFLAEYDTDNLIYGTFDGKRVFLKMSGQGKAFGMILLIILGVGIFSLTARVLIEGGSSILRVFTSPFLHEYSKKLKQAKMQNQNASGKGQGQAGNRNQNPGQQRQRQGQQQKQQSSQPQQQAPQQRVEAEEQEPEVYNPSERPDPSDPRRRSRLYNNT